MALDFSMYLHARQFPHLAGKSDVEIRAIARSAMIRNPRLIRIMRLRNFTILAGLAVAIIVVTLFSGTNASGDTLVRFGLTLVVIGTIFTAAVLAWNLIWVNTVVFRITREEVARREP
ncbi:MAG: hypothetical protein SFU86_25865 [Pirellulaceae bacterium]|nr:hypothetical protein [Pirellulaceae bacterium]